MNPTLLSQIVTGITNGEVVPYLGPGVLRDVRDRETGEAMPADSDSLILAMNNGRAMSPRLMYEFPRAAMHIEQRRGRPFVEHFLNRTYGQREWTRSAIHDWLAALNPRYVVDINRDTQLLDSYVDTPHILILGTARTMGNGYRYQLFQYDGSAYSEVEPEKAIWDVPILFKPMGAPRPEASYIASDADYVDYITELMGGFALPGYLKAYRQGLRYVFLGLRFTRDTERMIMSDIIYSAAEPAGWAFIPEPTRKEQRFCAKQGIEIIEADPAELLSACPAYRGSEAEVSEVGC